ncbi:phage major capsid protein [Ramlibacter monticola]|uniref:Phage major capsid protein n=1 Tax=Ramlibacter monticola TaxID=1926872 RepID=A0A936YYM9_9BURK|nr:phage major capsid protein [Ramlibacter monticola]MBL0390536.1 phage major capsid protein [Ramlibacter monticola]
MSLEVIMKSLETVERNLAAMSEKADGELKTLGKVSADTKAALDNIGTQQRELADRLTALEQKGVLRPEGEAKADGWGDQLVKSPSFKAFADGGAQKVRVEVKNTLTGSDANVAPHRTTGIVPGAHNILTIESLYSHIPCSSNAIEYTKEASFTNNAAEAAEGAAKAESALTWSLVNMPVSTVAHWIKISRQLAMDNVALAAYVDARMRYGVQRKVETQLVSGDGTAPNISGFMDSGNYTAHGIADAALGSALKKLVLIRKIIGDLEVAGYAPNAIVLNPADWATIETDLLVSAVNAVRVAYNQAGQPMLWGVPVVKSVGMTADTFAVGDFTQHGNIYDREGVVVQLSESDSDNFTKNLITLRAERRLALTSEVPAAIRAGDLTPA